MSPPLALWLATPLAGGTFRGRNSARKRAFCSRPPAGRDQGPVRPGCVRCHAADSVAGEAMREATVSDDELHAYMDGALDPMRRLEIASYLAGHPLEAARAEAFRAQREGLRALFDHVLDQPVPH